MSKHSRLVSRLVLLGLAVVLTVFATSSTMLAATCTPGALRVIIVNSACCGSGVRVTKQNQVCSTCCGWLNTGSPYCANNSFCAN